MNLFDTPYGTVCMRDNKFDTTILFATPNNEIYYFTNVSKVDLQETLDFIDISDDGSKLYIIIANSNVRYEPYGSSFYIFDLENVKNNTYSSNNLVNLRVNPLIEITNKDVVNVLITNTYAILTESSGEKTKITFE